MNRFVLSSAIDRGWILRLALVAWLISSAESSRAADRIVLRNLKSITDQTVEGFDEDGVRLSDMTLLGWGEIEKAKVAPDQQAAFDKLLGELGEDLYRIGQRLRVGDYAGVLPHAEALQARYRGRHSDTAYQIFQSLMWARLAVGQREAALAPYLRSFEILRKRGTARAALPGERRLTFDPATGLTSELAPVWFDRAAAKAALPQVLEVVRAMSERPDGVYIYFATLAIAAGEDATGERVLQGVRASSGPVAELREIIAGQRQVLGTAPADGVQRLRQMLGRASPDNEALALYWLGRGELRATDAQTQQQGVLDLLRIPALYGRTQGELSAAALFEASQGLSGLNDPRGSVAVRGELLAEYGGTYHARLVTTRRPDEARP